MTRCQEINASLTREDLAICMAVASRLKANQPVECERRDFQLSRILAHGRERHRLLALMDRRWATGARHSVLANAEQVLPAVRP